MKVHRVWNKAAERIGEEVSAQLLTLLSGQMQGGYRLALPLLCHGSQPQYSIILLARAGDFRLRVLKDVTVTSEATHVFVFFVFAREAEWRRFAKQITRAFPEQPQYGA